MRQAQQLQDERAAGKPLNAEQEKKLLSLARRVQELRQLECGGEEGSQSSQPLFRSNPSALPPGFATGALGTVTAGAAGVANDAGARCRGSGFATCSSGLGTAVLRERRSRADGEMGGGGWVGG